METTTEYTQYTLFTSGVKPAYFTDSDTQLSKKYPYTILDNNYIFFQNEQMKKEFTDQIQATEKNSPEYHRIIGETLGYPPQAINFFVQCMENKELEKKRAYFNYAGINFTANVEQALEITYWLWKNIRIPMDKVKIEYMGIKYLISPNT